VVLLDHPNLESQLLRLVCRANRIDHQGGEHDDYANAATGAVWLANEHKVFNPNAVPIGIGHVHNPFASWPRGGGTESPPRSRIPVPIGVGDTGFSIGGSDREDDYQGAKPDPGGQLSRRSRGRF
jgi:hypothetical protein